MRVKRGQQHREMKKKLLTFEREIHGPDGLQNGEYE